LTNTILDLPVNLLKSFIVGYHSADGSVYKNSRRHRISSVSRELIYGVAQCITKVYNIPYSIYKTKNPNKYIIDGREVNQRDYYTLVYDFVDPLVKKSLFIDNYIWTPLTRVEQTEEIEEVFDIEVDVDHSFTANGCIVHNCQDISISGVQKGIKKGTRSGLLFEVERILKHNRPKFLMMENVKNLISKNHMDAFKTYMETLEGFGYGNAWRVFNGVDFGCPQNRERVFMLSVLGETSEHVKQKLDSIQFIPRVNGHTNPMRPYIEDNVEDGLFVNAPYTLNEKKEKRSVCNLIARRDDISYDQTRRIYSLDGASPCLTTSGSPQIMLDNGKFRTITAREGYRFMGVKDEDIDTILSKTNLSHRAHVALAGNSICIPVMEAIYNEFFNEYKNIDKTVLVNSDN
jgi:DNA (cytosine-5)-methyltransferase 1